MVVKSILASWDICGVAMAVFLIVAILLYYWCKGNPFLVVPPLNTTIPFDETQRKRWLRMPFNERRIPKDIDVIVIGSGMSGLVCAACLSRMGKRVLVLEQHDRAGGSTHTFETQGFEFDVGVHYVGSMQEGDMNHILFDALTDSQLIWEKMDESFDAVVLKNKDTEKLFYFGGNQSEYVKKLLQYFPNEESAINKFDNLLKESKKAAVVYALMKQLPKVVLNFLLRSGFIGVFFPRYKELSSKSVSDVLNELTNNEELKFVFSYPFGDYGTFPSKAPFLMHGMLMEHFREGAFYPRGGSSELALNIIPGILRGGGNVLVNAPVDKILTDTKGVVTGVSVTRLGKSVQIKAPVVVSSVGLVNTFQKLLPPTITEKNDLKVASLDKGWSCFQTFIGLDGNSEHLGLEKKNYWIANTINVERSMKEYFALTREEAAEANIPLAFISFPSAKDSTWVKRYPGKSVCTAVTFVNWEWFKEWKDLSGLTTKDHVYNELKLALQEQMLKIVKKTFPQLAEKIDFAESGTPLSHKHYIGSPRGEVYGIDHSMGRFQPDLGMKLRPTMSIPGLYLTGQDIFTCGVMGAAISGIVTSGAIQGRNHFLDLYAAMAVQMFKRLMKSVARKSKD